MGELPHVTPVKTLHCTMTIVGLFACTHSSHKNVGTLYRYYNEESMVFLDVISPKSQLS